MAHLHQSRWIESPMSPAVPLTPPAHAASAPPVVTTGANPSYYSSGAFGAQPRPAWQGGFSPQQQSRQHQQQWQQQHQYGYGSQSPQQAYQQRNNQQQPSGYAGRGGGWSAQSSPRSGGYTQQSQQRQYSPYQQDYGRRGDSDSGGSSGGAPQRGFASPSYQPRQQHYGRGGAHAGHANRGGGGGAAGGPSATPMDSKPFALSLHSLACRFGGRGDESESAAAASVATIQRNITSFTSLNPLQRSRSPGAFAVHTLRGLVYRNEGMIGHGSIAIMEVGGAPLPRPAIVWGLPEVRNPQARLDRPDLGLVDFAAAAAEMTTTDGELVAGTEGADSATVPALAPVSDSAVPRPVEYVVRRRTGGRVYTVFKYPSSAARNAPELLCVKRADNSPYWKPNSFEGQGRQSPSPSPSQPQQGPVDNASRNQIATDACNLRMIDRLEQLLAASPSSGDSASAGAPSSVQQALSLLRSTPALQSLTVDWSGRDLDDEDCLRDASLLPPQAHMEPLYFTNNDGTITLCVDTSATPSASAVSASPAADLTASLMRGSFDPASAASTELFRSLVAQFLAHDTAANEAHRAAHPESSSADGLGGQRFAEVGRDLFFVDRAAPRPASAGADVGDAAALVVRRRMCFALLPSQVVAARDQVLFSPALESAIRASLAQLCSEQRTPATLALRPGQSLPSWASAALLAKLGAKVPQRRLARVRLNILAYATAILQAQTAKAQSTPRSANPQINTMQRMLVLVAFPGAGKSYFSERLMQATARANAAAVEAAAAAAPAVSATSSASPLSSSPVAPLLDPSVAPAADSPLDSSGPASSSPDSSSASTDSFIPVVAAGRGRGRGQSRNNSNTSAPPPVPGVVPKWVRINQDTLGSRKQCEFYAEKAIKEGHSVIIDRTNIDIGQRSTWLNLAQRYGLAHVEAVFLAVPVATCKQRVLDRVNHETLPATAASLSVVDRFLHDLVPPIPEEGFSRVHVLQRSDDPAEQQRHMDQLLAAVQKHPAVLAQMD